MTDSTDLAFSVVAATLVVFLFLASAAVLLVINTNRRIRHRAELAELKLARDREVMDAEREARHQTLQEVGRELHDNLGQLLTVVRLGLYAELDANGQAQRIRTAIETLELSINEVRRMGRSLNSDLWTGRSLAEAIGAEVERIERMGLATVKLVLEGGPSDLAADAKTILFRVFQEVVNNALKHGRAEVISIHFTDGIAPALTITDNGRGFDLQHTAIGTGTVNIRRRCELIGFRAELDTAPGQGTTWRITRGHGT